MKLQGKNKFDTWLLNSDWTKSHKYFLVAFILLSGLQAYFSYTNYIEGNYYGAVIDAFSAGLFITSAAYYSIILIWMTANTRLSKVNVELVIENHNLKHEILINKIPNK